MTLKSWLFTIRILGVGTTVEEAWTDATESTDLTKDPCPDKEDYELFKPEEEEDE